MTWIDELKALIWGITNWEQKYPGGEGIYHLFEIDLSTAREDKKYKFSGDQLIITDCEAQVHLRLNSKINDLIDLNVVRNIGSRFKEFYITNSASAGKTLNILAGANGIFNCNQPQLVDIARCNYGNLPIDIQANGIGNLPVDIKASTIGNIDVDLNAQSIGNLDINLNAQSIDRLLFRDHEGGIESSNSLTKNCPKATETTIHNLASGLGGITSFFIYVTAQTGSHYIAPRIYIDGTLMHPALHFGEWNTMGADTNSRPFQLMNYAVNGLCSGQYYFIKPIVFDTSLSLRVYNHSATDDVTANFYWFYQKIT